MDAKILNTIGLTLSIVGGVIWFFYGFPQPTLDEGMGLALEDNTPLEDGRTVAEHNEDIAQMRSNYLMRSKLALAVILVGFLFQLWATWA